MYSKTKIWN